MAKEYRIEEWEEDLSKYTWYNEDCRNIPYLTLTRQKRFFNAMIREIGEIATIDYCIGTAIKHCFLIEQGVDIYLNLTEAKFYYNYAIKIMNNYVVSNTNKNNALKVFHRIRKLEAKYGKYYR